MTDERILFKQVRHCLEGPLTLGALGKLPLLPPPLLAALPHITFSTIHVQYIHLLLQLGLQLSFDLSLR